MSMPYTDNAGHNIMVHGAQKLGFRDEQGGVISTKHPTASPHLQKHALSPDKTPQKALTSESKLATQSCTPQHHILAGPSHMPADILSDLLLQQSHLRSADTPQNAFVA